MIVFTTNIAETSLTIEGVKLVIDSGFAKEARFDVEKKIKMLELKIIPLSCANQRKGRAGRIESGKCLRLYSEEKIQERKEITPEILRSSLDDVVLQLLMLKLNPLEFDFIDQPDKKFIKESIDILKKLECIDQQHQITNIGKLFFDLPFSPRMSRFVYQCYLHNSLKLGAICGSIMSAPGQIFFMGGQNQEEKTKRKRKIAEMSADYESDLYFYYEIYQGWIQAGTNIDQDNYCYKCDKNLKKQRICRKCRSEYAVDNSLNNRTLMMAYQMCQSVVSIFKKFEKQGKLGIQNKQKINVQDLLGQSMAISYSEQIVQIIVPQIPSLGVRIIESDKRGIISMQSCLSQKVKADPIEYFIAMEAMELDSGVCILSQVTPIDKDWVLNCDMISQQIKDNIESRKISVIYEKCNIGPIFNGIFQMSTVNQYCQEENLDQKKQYFVGFYDKEERKGKFYGENQYQKKFSSFIDDQIQEVEQETFDRKVFYWVGSQKYQFIFSQGYQDMQFISPYQMVTIFDIPKNVKNENQFHKWLQNMDNLRYNQNQVMNLKITKDYYKANIVFQSQQISDNFKRRISKNHLKENQNVEYLNFREYTYSSNLQQPSATFSNPFLLIHSATYVDEGC